MEWHVNAGTVVFIGLKLSDGRASGSLAERSLF